MDDEKRRRMEIAAMKDEVGRKELLKTMAEMKYNKEKGTVEDMKHQERLKMELNPPFVWVKILSVTVDS